VADEGAGRILAELSQVDAQLHDCLLIGARISNSVEYLHRLVDSYKNNEDDHSGSPKHRATQLASLRSAIGHELGKLQQAVDAATKICGWEASTPEVTPVESGIQVLLDIRTESQVDHPPVERIRAVFNPEDENTSIENELRVHEEEAVQRRR
jgi:hypothetical protein